MSFCSACGDNVSGLECGCPGSVAIRRVVELEEKLEAAERREERCAIAAANEAGTAVAAVARAETAEARVAELEAILASQREAEDRMAEALRRLPVAFVGETRCECNASGICWTCLADKGHDRAIAEWTTRKTQRSETASPEAFHTCVAKACSPVVCLPDVECVACEQNVADLKAAIRALVSAATPYAHKSKSVADAIAKALATQTGSTA